MRPYILTETNWKYIKDAKIDLAILPWGATEAHNYHLPYGTDVIEADFIAAESARIAWEKGAKIVVLPTIPFGVNTGQADIRLDINLNPSTQLAILADIIDVLNRQGIFKLIILNSHGGNDFKTMLRELGLRFPGMFLSTCNWFHALDKSLYFEKDGDHADEMETSLILYFKPGLVLPLSEAGDGNEKKLKIKAFAEKWVWTERKWSQISADTGVGDPYAATREKGEKYFIAVTEKIGNLFVELSVCDVKDMYEQGREINGLSVGIVGAVPYVMVRAFPARVRFTGLSFSYNVAYAIFGGLTPIAVTSLLPLNPMAHAYYLLFIAALAFVLGLYLMAKGDEIEADAGIEELTMRSTTNA